MKRETLTIIGAAALFLTGCTTDVDVWITSGGESTTAGDEPETTDGTSTGLGVSETSAPGSTSDTSESGSTSDGSSTAATGSTAGDGCSLDPASWQCMCDGQPAHPSECDCFGDPIGWCTCPEGSIHQECPGACFVTDGVCECWGEPANPLECGCFVDAAGLCACNGHEQHPPETCEGLCIWVNADEGPVCVCDGAVGPDEACGECAAVGAACQCGGVLYPPEFCAGAGCYVDVDGAWHCEG
jgi:hypothetical protein